MYILWAFAKAFGTFFSEENVLHFSCVSTQIIDDAQKEIYIMRLWSNWLCVKAMICHSIVPRKVSSALPWTV